MPAYVITGKLGAGKSLVAVSRILEYLNQGRKVATNINLYPENLVGYWSKRTKIFRIPNKPTIDDLNALPLGHDGDSPDDNMNGALVLDECGTWFNSRGWNEKGRAEIIEWFRNARKKRWDIFFIIQDVSVMDGQARESFAEHVVYCRRMDRFSIPILKHFGLKMPKVHMGIVKYGHEHSSPVVEKWFYRGTNLYSSYDTEQSFTANDEIVALASVLPAWYTHGRYITKWEKFKHDWKTKRIAKHWFFLAGALVASFAVNALVTYLPEQPKKGIWSCNDAYKQLYGSCEAKPIAKLEYYHPELATGSQSASTPSPAAIQQKEPDKPEEQTYFTGYTILSNGVIEMYFSDEKGNAKYIDGYAVKSINDCKASVRFGNSIKEVFCLPRNIAYQQMDRPPLSALPEAPSLL